VPDRRGLWQVSALVVLGHGAVLTQLSTAPATPPRGPAGLPVQLLYVRTVQPQVLEKVPAPPAAPAPEATAQSPAATPPVPAPHAQEAQPPVPRLDAMAGPGAEPLAAAPMPVPAASAAAEEAPYLPRGELTLAPKLLAPVQVPFPGEVEGWVELKVQVTLFIDEEGTVRRIRIDSPDVHPSFERAVRAAFSPARFSPGELQDTAVRSQVRLEVEFSSPSRRRR
jgi:TonB family protein